MGEHSNIQIKLQRVSRPGASAELGNGKMYRTAAEKLRIEQSDKRETSNITITITITINADSMLPEHETPKA
jgi:hypothetical protein